MKKNKTGPEESLMPPTSIRFRREVLRTAKIRAAQEELCFKDFVERTILFYCLGRPVSQNGHHRDALPPGEAPGGPEEATISALTTLPAQEDRRCFSECVMYLQQIFSLRGSTEASRRLATSSVHNILGLYAKGIELEALRQDADARPTEKKVLTGDHQSRREVVPRGA